jgi:N-acetylmuramoyl-L-alanine amidase
MKQVLCVDAGHGQSNARPGVFDPGAVAGQQTEAEIVFAYAQALVAELGRRGLAVVQTRPLVGSPAPVGQRSAAAQRAGATAMLSLHMNAAASSLAKGTETLYSNSQAFASAMQRATLTSMGLRDRGVKQRTDLAVLRFPGPAALIELGFISNALDLGAVLDPLRRQAWVQAVADAWEQWR